MKPLLVFINLVGPVDNPTEGKVHQLEFGVSLKDSNKPDVTRMIVPKANTVEALELILPLITKFVEKHYPQPKTPKPENIVHLHD